MSQRHNLQDATGVIENWGALGIGKIVQAVAPTDGQPGYAVGCEWVNNTGAAGNIRFVNVGTLASSNWFNVL